MQEQTRLRGAFTNVKESRYCAYELAGLSSRLSLLTLSRSIRRCPTSVISSFRLAKVTFCPTSGILPIRVVSQPPTVSDSELSGLVVLSSSLSGSVKLRYSTKSSKFTSPATSKIFFSISRISASSTSCSS